MPPRPQYPTAAQLLCGVDEAGRGPLAGSVFAAAVVLDPARRVNGLRDSKALTPEAREQLSERIRDKAIAWAVAHATVEEIDRMNILRASLLAMQRAVAALGMSPEEVCVDGNVLPEVPFPCTAVVKGDQRVAAIAAASILAKVARDADMAAMESRYPGYGFASHKGYCTPEHLAALKSLGPCEIHRRSFEPVHLLLCQPELPF
jgi:ribonuclease HII